MKGIVLISMVSIFLLSGCEEERITIYKIDPALIEYVNSFYVEAEKRGMKFPKENLIVRLDSTNSNWESNYAGMSLNEKGHRIVLIHYKSYKKYNTTNIKILVFHELGHAILKRHHIDDKKSIMYPGMGIIPLTDQKEIIDELFGVSTVNS